MPGHPHASVVAGNLAENRKGFIHSENLYAKKGFCCPLAVPYPPEPIKINLGK